MYFVYHQKGKNIVNFIIMHDERWGNQDQRDDGMTMDEGFKKPQNYCFVLYG